MAKLIMASEAALFRWSKAIALPFSSVSGVPTYANRNGLIDALGLLADNNFPVCLETNHPSMIVPRVAADHALCDVTVLNISIVESPELLLTLREIAGRWIFWHRPKQTPLEIQGIPCHEYGGIAVRRPKLPGRQIGTISFE